MTAPVAESSLRSWLQQSLQATPVRRLFARRQTAYTVGYRLDDGRSVVVKARHDSLARVDACLAVQAGLFASSYPCPRPLTEAALVDGLTVHAEEFRDTGDRLRGDDMRLASPFARSYADLMNRLGWLGVVPAPEVLHPPVWIGWWRQRPWSPSPRVPATVFTAADRVRERLRLYDGPAVLGHADWESQNLRWSGESPVVVYDWDSLTWLPEPVLVGAAASSYSSDLQPDVTSIEATAAFLDSYQQARRQKFTAEELEVAWTAGLLPVLFNARAEALDNRRPLILPQLDAQVDERLRRGSA